MKFKLYVAVEQHHIDAEGKPLSEPWDLFVEPWQYTRILQRPDLAGDMGWRKKAIVRLYVGPVVDLTGITLYVGTDSWRWNVYCADCPDQVSEFYRTYDPHMPFEPFRSRSCSAAQRRHKESFKFEECM